MARKPRIHYPGALYHVILRGNCGQPIFLREEDRYRFFLLLQEGTCRFGCRVHGYCLMTNHLHLALQVGELPLSHVMQNLSFRYTRWINWRENRTGHLFHGRYRAILVDADAYLLELIRYLHLNPYRAGMIDDPVSYPWSSHRAYLGREAIPWLTTEWVLGQFGQSVMKARNRFREYVFAGLVEGHRPDFHRGGTDPRLLGDDQFLDKCLAESAGSFVRVSMEDVIVKVCEAYALEQDILASPSQQRHLTEARAVIAWLCRELGCATLSVVGRHLHRDVGSLSSAVRRLSERMREQTSLADRILSLKAALDGCSP